MIQYDVLKPLNQLNVGHFLLSSAARYVQKRIPKGNTINLVNFLSFSGFLSLPTLL